MVLENPNDGDRPLRGGVPPNPLTFNKQVFDFVFIYKPDPPVREGPLDQAPARCHQEGRASSSAPLLSCPLTPPRVHSGAREKR